MDGIQVVKDKFVPLIREFVEQAAATSYDYYINILSTEVIESKLGSDDFSEYIRAEETKDCEVVVTYEVRNKSDNKLLWEDNGGKLESRVRIPIPLHNFFIISGKVRAPLNYMEDVQVCKRYDDRLVFDWDRVVEYSTNSIRIKTYDEDGKYTETTYTFDDLHKAPADSLKLTEEMGKRLFVQHDQLNYIPKVIDKKLLEILRTPSKTGRSHITKKKIVSTYDALYIYLTNKSYEGEYWSIVRASRNRFNRLKKFYEATLNTSIMSYFKGKNNDYMTGLSNETNINPATHETMSNKLILEKYSHGKPDGAIAPTDYNESLALIVDPSMTPDSMNINRVNEMNSSVRYDGFDTYIKVINIHTGRPTELTLLDYLCTPILTSQFYDYKANKVKLDASSDGKVHYRFKGEYVSKSRKEIDDKFFKYVDTPSDDRLSKSTRNVPNTNYSDSVRVSMGARMSNQSITVASCELPMVTTGHKDHANSTLMIRHKGEPGVVTGITNEIVIRDDSGKDYRYKIPENLGAQYNINTSFDIEVAVGDKVRDGQLLIKPMGITKDGAAMLGMNAFVAFASYKGYTYEDGAVVSQSFANKLTHTYILDVEANIYDTDTVSGFVQLGTQVKAGEILGRLKRQKSASRQVRQITDIFFKEDDQKLDFDVDIRCPNNVYEGYVVDFTYNKGGGINTAAEEVVDNFYMHRSTNVTLPFKYHYNKLVRPKDEPDEKYAIKVTYRIVVRAALQVGDKISNMYGSKGVVTLILPDNEMWRTKDGKIIDCILNPFAVISRKNTSQTMEAGLGLISYTVLNQINERKLLEKPVELRKILKKYKFDDYLELSDSQIVDKIKTDGKLIYTVGCYGRISPKEIADMLDSLGLDDGKLELFKPDGKPLRGKVVCGYQYMMKLQFLVTYSNKVTSDDFDTQAMVLGYGGTREDGQSLEEMIFWALQSHGASKAIDKFRDASKNSEYWLRSHIITAGLDLIEADAKILKKQN